MANYLDCISLDSEQSASEKYILVIAQSDLSRISGRIHPKILNESLFKEASPKIQFSHKSVHETFKQKRLLENENELNATQLEDFRTDNSELIEPVISWATMIFAFSNASGLQR